MLRLTGLLITVLAAIFAAIVTWPQFFRLERTFPFAQLVAVRPVVILAAAAIAAVFVLLCAWRRVRPFAASIATIALLAAIVGAAILGVRGVTGGALPAPTDNSVRVMTWNTAGAATDPETIAQTAVAMQADIVALPETTAATGEAVAVAMRERGRPMWAHHESYQGWDANDTTLLISPRLGDYAVVTSEADGTVNTATVPSVVAMPIDGAGPIVVAAHVVAPRDGYMQDWRDGLQWLADQCAADDVIMAGDFNATVDNMARLGSEGGTLGRCHDAATTTGTGGIGTWSTSWPKLLGTPIDHVLATERWHATGSVVVASLDDAGSDHRPVVVQLETAG